MSVAVLAAICAAACSVLLDSEEPQCKVDADCIARGPQFANTQCVSDICQSLETAAGSGGSPIVPGGAGGTSAGAPSGGAGGDDAGGAAGVGGSAGSGGVVIDPQWMCIGSVPAEPAGTGTVTVTMNVSDYISTNPIVGAAISACAQLDVTCANPIGMGGTTDAMGNVVLQVPAGFTGFFFMPEVDMPTTGPSHMAEQIYVETPVQANYVRPNVYTFVEAEYRVLVENDPNNVWDPTKSHFFLQTYDCNAMPAAGVVFGLTPADPTTVTVYLRDGAPDRTAPYTDATGLGGFILAPADYLTATGTVADSGQHLGDVHVHGAPNTILLAIMAPARGNAD